MKFYWVSLKLLNISFLEFSVVPFVNVCFSLDDHGMDFDQYGILIKVKFR